MNWYKLQLEKQAAPQIKTIKDRNRVNERIKKFKDMAEKLRYLQDYIVQNPPDAQEKLREIAEDKVTSSFPELQEILGEAVFKARDNYDVVAEACDVAIEKIYIIIKDMETERKKFSDEVLPKRLKDFKERKKDNGIDK